MSAFTVVRITTAHIYLTHSVFHFDIFSQPITRLSSFRVPTFPLRLCQSVFDALLLSLFVPLLVILLSFCPLVSLQSSGATTGL